MATKAPAAPKKRAPAIRPPAPDVVAPPELVDAEASTAGPLPVMIMFRDRPMVVLRPNEAQLALLIDASQWMSRATAQLRKIREAPEGASDDHPLVQEAMKSAERGLAHVGRLQRIIGSLFEDEDDWDWICEQMAERKLPWQEVADLPAKIITAHNEADRMVPVGREAKRAAARGKRV